MVQDISGKRYGNLVALEFAGFKQERSGKRYQVWKFKCDCGNEKTLRLSNVKKGDTQSCGCLQAQWRQQFGKRRITHHSRKTRLYDIWSQMRKRCQNKNDTVYKYYGEKGVCVCDEWNNDFVAFQRWAMSHGYNPNAKRGECTLDRIDPFGNYEPTNCRWISIGEQQRNKRRNNTKEESKNDPE